MVISTSVRVSDWADWVCTERKKIGPRTEPWGTPIWSSAGCERVLSTLTKCVLPDRYLNQPSASLLIPQ